LKSWNLLLLAAILLAGCKSSEVVVTDEDVILDDAPEPSDEPTDIVTYQPSETRRFDLLDTKLWVSFDWTRERLHGRALLRLKPYFYPASVLVLDAKGMDIHRLQLVNEANRDLAYTYKDSLLLEIHLPKPITRQDTIDVLIEYTAKPKEFFQRLEQNALVTGTSIASGNDIGLYFINADESDPEKPRQLWTQGETEASSFWFPTIDAPNERTTQEMFMTVEAGYTTVSNGVLVDQKDNGDGTRTDHWLMTQPHAPYLFMMAVGPFAKVTDRWRDLPVDYYVDSAYAPYAKDVFGHTPEMLEFFSTVLGVDYPWPKYAQVVVHDFVSGAMENTTATIHYDALHKTDRELLDGPMDDIISHELFHQWFGDLVTCESWSNIPLNESFATYGEYLWNEYKYGRDHADYYGQQDQGTYMRESGYKQLPLIRYRYSHRDDMFDRHSYQKGGRILHMLRKMVGDEAFFAGLQLYLKTNAYQAVEAHDLRLAFEQVTGQDLNGFFDSWFFSPGHPVLTIDYDYHDGRDTTYVAIWQTPSSDSTPLFTMPICVDIYREGTVERLDTFIAGNITGLKFPGQPDLINVDAEKMLLCTKEDNKSPEAFNFQYAHAPLFLDRYEALEACIANQWALTASRDVLFDAFDDPFWGLRAMAISELAHYDDILQPYIAKLKAMARHDKSSTVRVAALAALQEHLAANETEILVQALADSSYEVVRQALLSLYTIDSATAYEKSKALWNETNSSVARVVSEIVATQGGPGAEIYYEDIIPKLSWWPRTMAVRSYGDFLPKLDDAGIMRGCTYLTDVAGASDAWLITLYVTDILGERIAAFQAELDAKPDAARAQQLNEYIERLNALREQLGF
jgi:aminopeptidase N